MDTSLSPEEQAISDRIGELRAQLGDDLLILGHHYQRDSIVMHADFLGDSFMLSQKAAESDAKYIVFCGVHFMAESADILTSDEQIVVLPNMRAGCSMADMATLTEVESAWGNLLEQAGLNDPIERDDPTAPAGPNDRFLVPVTYMNSSADLKDFVGRHGGIVCTSSNAQGILNWAFDRAGPHGAVLFFPDQHLGRNTGHAMGIPLDLMPTWTPGIGAMGELNGSRIILWHGFCSVHKRFTPSQIENFRFLKSISGLRSLLNDGNPVIGSLKKNKKVICAFGHFRHGILLAPITAEIVSDYVFEKKIKSNYFFSPNRFNL